MASTSTPTSSISSTGMCLATIMAPTPPNRLLGSLALVRSGPRSITRESSNSALKSSGDPSLNEVTRCTLMAGRLVALLQPARYRRFSLRPEAPCANLQTGPEVRTSAMFSVAAVCDRRFSALIERRYTVDAASLRQAGASARVMASEAATHEPQVSPACKFRSAPPVKCPPRECRLKHDLGRGSGGCNIEPCGRS